MPAIFRILIFFAGPQKMLYFTYVYTQWLRRKVYFSSFRENRFRVPSRFASWYIGHRRWLALLKKTTFPSKILRIHLLVNWLISRQKTQCRLFIFCFSKTIANCLFNVFTERVIARFSHQTAHLHQEKQAATGCAILFTFDPRQHGWLSRRRRSVVFTSTLFRSRFIMIDALRMCLW